jgi:polyphosphate kinase
MPRTPKPNPPPLHAGGKALYFNRELSWLAFNRRVLSQAWDRRNPLLERLKFLAIVASNLDEFFEIRVAGLIQQAESDVAELSIDGLGPREQLRRIHSVVGTQIEDQYRCWSETIVPELRGAGIVFKTARELNKAELRWVRAYFKKQVAPVITPLAVDASHPFPQIGNKSLNVVVSVDDPSVPGSGPSMAILPVPRILPRVVEISPARASPGRGRRKSTRAKTRNRRFIFLSEIVKLCASSFFTGFRVSGAHAFRVTRNSDLYIDEEESENLLKKIEEELRNLRRGAAVRIEIEDGVADPIFDGLCDRLDISSEYAFRLNGPLNLARLMAVYEMLDRPELKYPPFRPHAGLVTPPGTSLFKAIRAKDHLLHHPFDSFEPVVRFVEDAARDPRVVAIKQTLYRTSGDSPIVRALIEAAGRGKQVTALVELKARGDEANNIQWARQLEEAGVHVVYGVSGLKIHCKCCLIVRRERDGMRHYAHLGTGNYNPRTARLYTDFSFFTARREMTAEVAHLFNVLTGFVRKPRFEGMLVAPHNYHPRIQELIQRETKNAFRGNPARIIAKMNSLVDRTTIQNLYAASKAGVQIDLIVRGICCLVPGVRYHSENIRVRSIVGRFLEHSRAYYFENSGGNPEIFVGSGDWMFRNFFRRVELIFPVGSPALRRRIVDDILAAHLRDTVNARELKPNGAYLPVAIPSGGKPFSSHTHCMKEGRRKGVRE